MTIRKLLHDHGLLTDRMFDIIANDVLKDEVVDAMFEVLCADNEALKNMFTLEADTVVSDGNFLNKSKHVVKKKLLINYYGLLEGHLLNGDILA